MRRAVADRGVVLFRLGGPAEPAVPAMLTRLISQDLLAAARPCTGSASMATGWCWLAGCGSMPRSSVTEMIKRGPEAGLPVLATTTSGPAVAELASLVNVVVAQRMSDGVASPGLDGARALRDGEFMLTVAESRAGGAACGLRPGPGRSMMPAAADRLYLGWQYAVPQPDPGPPPRRPTPPEQERLSPAWAAAQRREEKLLNRPLKAALAAVTVLAAVALAAAALGWLPVLAAGLAVMVCVLVAAVCGYGLWQGERALRSRMADERSRVGKIRAAQESELFAWQAGHASRVREWQAQRIAHEHQKRWYGVSVPGGITRVDVAGGTLSGWSAMLATAAGHRLAAGAEVTVLDLTEGSVALDLIASAREAGLDPLVRVLPEDLPTLGLGTGLDGRALADVLSLVAGATGEQASTRDLAFDHAILERIIDVLGGTATVAGVAAALRALAQAGDPRADVAAGVITAAQVDRLTTMFGRGAADRVVVERAWVLESQLRILAAVGTAAVPLPRSPLRVLAVSHRAGSVEGTVLSTYLAVLAAHTIREAHPAQPWQHTLFVLGADRLRGDTLDRLTAGCERTGTGLVLAYRSVPPHVKQRLGRGNAAVAFMRLGNAEDARAASEQLGTEHRFVLSQLTETVGLSVTDSTAGSYTSTAGSVSSLAESWSVSEGRTSGTSRSRTGSQCPADAR